MSDSIFNREKSKLSLNNKRRSARTEAARPSRAQGGSQSERARPQRPVAGEDLGFAGRSSYDKQKEVKLYGEKACLAVFAARPHDIVRLYLTDQTAPRFAQLMKFLAANKRAYHVLPEAELEKIGGTSHHEGVVMLVRRKPWLNLAQWLSQPAVKGAVLALDEVANPHNLGAIMRSAAHFGVRTIISTRPELLQSGAAVRTAEGGFEGVDLVRVPSLAEALPELRAAGFALAFTSSHQGQSLYTQALPEGLVLVLGEEKQGVSQALLQAEGLKLSIPGVGAVESLNVSVAAALLMGEWYRQWRSRG